MSLALSIRGAGMHHSSVRPMLARPVTPNSEHADRNAALVARQYLGHGGIVGSDEFSARVRAHINQPISQVARWIVAREVVQFWWGGETQFPLFQFDLTRMTLRPEVRRVVAELADAFDDLEVAEWFVRPNPMLSQALPVEVLREDAEEVFAAARAYRFVVLG